MNWTELRRVDTNTISVIQKSGLSPAKLFSAQLNSGQTSLKMHLVNQV